MDQEPLTGEILLLKPATSSPRYTWLALLVPSQFVATIICVAGLITALVNVRRLRRLITVSIRHQQF